MQMLLSFAKLAQPSGPMRHLRARRLVVGGADLAVRYAAAFDPPLHLQLLPLTSEMDVVQAQARNLWRAVSGAQRELASGRGGSAIAAEHRDLDQMACSC